MRKVFFIIFLLSVVLLTGCGKNDYESLVSSNNETEQKVEIKAKTNNKPINIKKKSEISLVNKSGDETVYVALDLGKYGKRYLETQYYEIVTPGSKYLAGGGSVDDVGSIYYLPAKDKIILTLDDGGRNQGCRSIQAFILDVEKKDKNPQKINDLLPREFSFIDNNVLVGNVCYEGKSLYGDNASISTYYTTGYYDISKEKSYSEIEYMAKKKRDVDITYNGDDKTNRKFIKEYYNLLKNNQIYETRKRSLWDKGHKDFETFDGWYENLEDVNIIDAQNISGNKYKIIVDTWYKEVFNRIESEKEVVYSGEKIFLKTINSHTTELPILSRTIRSTTEQEINKDIKLSEILYNECLVSFGEDYCGMDESNMKYYKNNLKILNMFKKKEPIYKIANLKKEELTSDPIYNIEFKGKYPEGSHWIYLGNKGYLYVYYGVQSDSFSFEYNTFDNGKTLEYGGIVLGDGYHNTNKYKINKVFEGLKKMSPDDIDNIMNVLSER